MPTMIAHEHHDRFPVSRVFFESIDQQSDLSVNERNRRVIGTDRRFPFVAGHQIVVITEVLFNVSLGCLAFLMMKRQKN